MLPTRDGLEPIQAQLNRYLQALPVRARAVVLVGSRARGTHYRDSDIDLVVVSESFRGMPRGDRIQVLLEAYYDSPALEPMGFTEEEIVEADDLYLWDALADGRPLMDDGTWKNARERFLERVRAGELTRTPTGWRESSSSTSSRSARPCSG